MGLDVTLYGSVVNLNEVASQSSSGRRIYNIWIWRFCVQFKVKLWMAGMFPRRRTKQHRSGSDCGWLVFKVKTITHTVNEF